MWCCRWRRQARSSTSRTAFPRRTWRRARSRWPRPRRCSRRAPSTSRSSIPASGGARADMLVEVGRQLLRRPRQRRAVAGGARARARSTGSKRRVPARAGQPDVPRPRRVRADRGPPGGRAPPPPTPARRSTRWSSSARRRCTSRAASSKGEVDPRRRLRQPHHLAAGRAVRGQRRRRRSRVQVEVEGAEGRFRPVFGRTFSDVRVGRPDRLHRLAAASWRSRAATARRRRAWAPGGARPCV